MEGWIDCGANDDMFLAIAALANDAFLKKAEGYPVDVDLEAQGFYRCNDAGTLPGECADFIFHKCND
jgi:hypothetical protein